MIDIKSTNKIEIYTDGACSGNPGIGGWGAVMLYDNVVRKEISGYDLDTTNNRMELQAVIESLLCMKVSSSITLYTDSKYVQQGITTWIHNWKKNNWKTASKKPVKNVDLWMSLDKEVSIHSIQWEWVKGHSNDKYNDRADELARAAIMSAKNSY